MNSREKFYGHPLDWWTRLEQTVRREHPDIMARMDDYLFVGGPADGKRYSVPESRISYAVPVITDHAVFHPFSARYERRELVGHAVYEYVGLNR